MSMLSIVTHRQTRLSSIAAWCRNWMASGGSLGRLEHIARDVGVSLPEPRTIAGKWPDAASLLAQRLAALQIDSMELRHRHRQAKRSQR